MWYAIVTFGTPWGKRAPLYRNREACLEDASKLKGTGTCSAVRVYECATAQDARTADISVIRNGVDRVISQW